jgi:outer membrane protein OmpA-like peptidoglycan-associated protein
MMVPLVGLLSCAPASVLRGRIDGLNQDVINAEKNGAMRCAPRELALAKAHLRFAAVELDQGQLSSAADHVAVAEPNAHAALEQSPPDRCAERKIVEARVVGDKDTDGDHIFDSRDQCILEPEDVDGYLDQDGCPEPDNDADGIPDSVDKCPNQPEDFDGFQDEDGCPDPDNDGDTVPDLEDFCPNTPGQPGGAKPGCPGLVIVTAKEIRITQQIHFEFDKATIRSESFPILDAVSQVMVANPKMMIEVQGHTDNKGSGPYNLKLSDARANSVRMYLVSHGVEAGRLRSVGYGLTQPIVPNTTDANRALNRRVQFIRTEGPAE